MNKQLILESASAIEAEAVSWWKHLHSIPELGLEEHETCSFLLEQLEKHGRFDKIQRVGETGLLVYLRGTKPSSEHRVLGLRGDMDALPIEEKSGVPYASTHPGCSHACGHDVHTTVLLASAICLSRLKEQFSGELRFFFQPCEETIKGARLFLNDPAVPMDDIDGLVALHTYPNLYVGTIATKEGPILAATDRFDIEITGVQSHGAIPEKSIDPVTAAASLIMQLQTIVSRNVSPVDAAVLTVGTIHAGSGYNIIPEKAELGGTIRTSLPETRDFIHERMAEMCRGLELSMGVKTSLTITRGVPPLICQKEWVDRAFRVGRELLGEDKVIELPHQEMGGEDFAFLKEKIPGVFIRLGVRTPGKPFYPLHSPYFYTDPGAVKTGIVTMLGMALDYLS